MLRGGQPLGKLVILSRHSRDKMENKKAAILHQVIIHIILVAAILGIFLMSSTGRTTSKQVRQQLIEKQLALFVDSAEPGMNFSLYVAGSNGKITGFEMKGGKFFISVNGGTMGSGYPFRSRYEVGWTFDNPGGELNDRYIIFVK
jgi:hypothetical protein